jgi:DNA-binding MarR family transcriptional regulator
MNGEMKDSHSFSRFNSIDHTEGTKVLKTKGPLMGLHAARKEWTAPFPFVLMDALLIAIGVGLAFDTDLEICSMIPLPFLLYSKMGQEKLLDNFIRGKIFGYIMANPGENYTSIMLSLDLPNGTFLHHLKRLEHENLIKSRTDGRQKRYYPANVMLPEPDRHILTSGQQTVYGLIEDDPGISQNEMARILRVSAVAVNYHLEALLDKGDRKSVV